MFTKIKSRLENFLYKIGLLRIKYYKKTPSFSGLRGPAGTGKQIFSHPVALPPGTLVTDFKINEIMRREGRVSGEVPLFTDEDLRARIWTARARKFLEEHPDYVPTPIILDGDEDEWAWMRERPLIQEPEPKLSFWNRILEKLGLLLIRYVKKDK